MSDIRKANSVGTGKRSDESKRVKASVSAQLPNAVDRDKLKGLVARKRHMSGLMCPAPGLKPVAPAPRHSGEQG